MKHSMRMLLTGILFFIAMPVNVLANNAKLDALAAREAKLEQELKQLQHELRMLRHSSVDQPKSKKRNEHHIVTRAQKQRAPKHRKPAPQDYRHDIITFLGGTPIVTSPYLGVRSEFNGHDLIVNISSIYEDVRLLQQHKYLEDALQKRGDSYPEHPLVDISGKLEGLANVMWPYSGSFTHDINLKSAELDAAIHINRWVVGYMAITYDNAPPRFFSQRAANSRLFLNKGFIAVGNLNTSPMFGSVGQLYVPFGRYSSSMLSSPLPLHLGRVKGRAIVVGYHPMTDNHFYVSGFIFTGDTLVGDQFQAGGDAGYRFVWGNVHGDIGASVISNLADADGMQATGGTGFRGFGVSGATENTVHRVPGVDGHFALGYGKHGLKGEVTTAVRRFNMADLAFNGRGALPWALNVEYDYSFTLFNKPSAVAVGYGHSAQSLALNIPCDTIVAAVNMAIWRDTIATIEYRHDINYATGTTAFGRGGLVPFPTAGLGQSADSITAQFGVYF